MRLRRNMDARLRHLERAAAAGDVQAQVALEYERVRLGQLPIPAPAPGVWVQVSGDMNPEDHGGWIAAWDAGGGYVDLRGFDRTPVDEPYPFWVMENQIDARYLTLSNQETASGLRRGERSIPQITKWFHEADLLHRASILNDLSTEVDIAGSAREPGEPGWSTQVLPVPPGQILWWGSQGLDPAERARRASEAWQGADETHARDMVESGRGLPSMYPWNAQAIYDELEDEESGHDETCPARYGGPCLQEGICEEEL
jgi:hypothetical protein